MRLTLSNSFFRFLNQGSCCTSVSSPSWSVDSISLVGFAFPSWLIWSSPSGSMSSACVIQSKYPRRSSSICCFSLSLWKSPLAFAFSLSFENSLEFERARYCHDWCIFWIRGNCVRSLPSWFLIPVTYVCEAECVGECTRRRGQVGCFLFTYPLKTPRIRFITKNAPKITIDTKYAHCQVLPKASWI